MFQKFLKTKHNRMLFLTFFFFQIEDNKWWTDTSSLLIGKFLTTFLNSIPRFAVVVFGKTFVDSNFRNCKNYSLRNAASAFHVESNEV